MKGALVGSVNDFLERKRGIRIKAGGRLGLRLEHTKYKRYGQYNLRAANPPPELGALGAHRLLEPPAPAMVDRAMSSYSYSFAISPACQLKPTEIDARIGAFPTWRYGLELCGRSVGPKAGPHGYHYQRYLHIFPALLSLTGGSLRGRTVLDVACDLGFWSLQAHAAGADRVVGVEANQQAIEQAKLILELTGIQGVTFREQNAYELSRDVVGEFDVSFYFGLLYHLDKPVLGLERLCEVTKEMAIVDTAVIQTDWPLSLLRFDRTHLHSNVLATIPSRSAVVMMLRAAGFRTVLRVPRTSESLPDIYRRGGRETFVALK